MIDPGKLIEIERALTDQLNSHVESGIKNSISRGHNNASDIGFECDTFQALCRLKGKLRPRISVGLKKIFRVGNTWEQPNIRWLQDAKINVRDTADKRFEWEKYNIVGYMEADITLPGLDPGLKIPLEHKTISPNGFRAIKACKHKGIPLTEIKQIWVRKYPGQLMTYMLFKEVELGVWFFFEKSTGDFLWWITQLDFGYTETLIQRAERTEENVSKGFVPPVVTKEICTGCDFSMTYCYPDQDYGPGFVFLSDKEAGEKLDRRDILREAHLEYSPLDKLIKDHFRGQNVAIKGERGTYKISTKRGDKKTTVSIEKI